MNKLYIFLLLSILTSCATDIDFHIPLNRFETPETNGAFLKGSVGFNFGASHKVTTAEVVETIFPSIFDPQVSEGTGIERSAHLSTSFSLGLIERVDFIYSAYGDGADVYGAKFQFLGETAREVKEGWKGSIQGTIGRMNEDEGSLNVNLSSGGVRNYNGHIKLKTYDISLNFGYRFNKYSIAYLNSIYSYYDTESTLNSNSFATINAHGIVRTYGSLLGVRLGDVGQFATIKLETGLMYSEWGQGIDETSVPVGVGVDFLW